MGTPTTEVVVVNSAGVQTAVLTQWPGAAGTPVRTTINPAVENAALTEGERIVVPRYLGRRAAPGPAAGAAPSPVSTGAAPAER